VSYLFILCYVTDMSYGVTCGSDWVGETTLHTNNTPDTLHSTHTCSINTPTTQHLPIQIVQLRSHHPHLGTPPTLASAYSHAYANANSTGIVPAQLAAVHNGTILHNQASALISCSRTLLYTV